MGRYPADDVHTKRFRGEHPIASKLSVVLRPDETQTF
jgi:hypothetical protein